MFRVSTALCGLARGRRLTVNIDVECGGPIADKSAPTVALCTPSNVGAGLPAIRSDQAPKISTLLKHLLRPLFDLLLSQILLVRGQKP